MKKTIITLGVLAALFLNPSCKPKEVVGPAGPTGATGTPGPNGTPGTNGTDGTDGKDGKNGNANVIGTNTLTLTSSSWSLQSNGSYQATLSVPGITQTIVDKGSVVAFISTSTSKWATIPVVLSNKQSIAYSFSLGEILLSVYSVDGSAISNPGTIIVRLDIIAAN